MTEGYSNTPERAIPGSPHAPTVKADPEKGALQWKQNSKRTRPDTRSPGGFSPWSRSYVSWRCSRESGFRGAGLRAKCARCRRLVVPVIVSWRLYPGEVVQCLTSISPGECPYASRSNVRRLRSSAHRTVGYRSRSWNSVTGMGPYGRRSRDDAMLFETNRARVRLHPSPSSSSSRHVREARYRALPILSEGALVRARRRASRERPGRGGK
jgi:hypothetical protein